jgi:hypothetical protein
LPIQNSVIRPQARDGVLTLKQPVDVTRAHVHCLTCVPIGAFLAIFSILLEGPRASCVAVGREDIMVIGGPDECFGDRSILAVQSNPVDATAAGCP